MKTPVLIPSIDDSYYVLPSERRDSVVMQAITNVTDRLSVEGWSELPPGGRTHAIYGEIRRLDLARTNGTFALAEGNLDVPHYQIA
jgi:hypothetical protein